MIKIFPSEQVKLIDAYTIEKEPVSGDNLMERAAAQCSKWLLLNYPEQHSFKIFAGPGNNGGDGLVIARLLAERNKNVSVYLVNLSSAVSELVTLNLQRAKEYNTIKIINIHSADDFPTIHPDDTIIDALFGSGLKRPLEGLYKNLVKYLNNSRVYKISIDIPSGLMGEDNSLNDVEAIFQADCTLTFEFPFLSFFISDNEKFVGKWHLLPIGLHPDIIKKTPTDFFLTEKKDIVLKQRQLFSHKGTYGHGLLIAGSYGMMGAVILSSKACLRTGIGLLTAHIPKTGYEILQTAVPEAMASVDKENDFISSLPDLAKYTAIAIGCGIGKNQQTEKIISQLIDVCKVPLVMDADALNILSNHPQWIKKLPADTILTPHPGEFDRLFGKSENGFVRLQKQKKAAAENHIIIILKGAYTSIALPDGRVFFNPTGNPGMATGGSGDVLTGMILSLLAQRYEPFQAALTAVFMHGLAGDLAAEKKNQESLIASDIIENISEALNKIKNK